MADFIQAHFSRAQNKGWILAFRQAGKDHDLAPSLLMAVASRETNMRNMVGDGGHGHGLMQIDDRSFPEWCASGRWRNAEEAIMKGAEVLSQKRASIWSAQGQEIYIGRKRFVGKSGLTPDDSLRTAIAAYNAGMWAYYGLTVHGDPDRMTTGRDYSRDVLSRAARFSALLQDQDAAP